MRRGSPRRVDVVRSIDKQVAAVNGMAVSDIAHDTGCPVDFSSRPDGTHYSDVGADAIAARLAPQIERLGSAALEPAGR